MSSSTTVSNGSQVALGADVATALYGVNGTGVKIGIISTGYDTDGGAAADVAAGNLPANVTVLSDLPAGSTIGNEGRAMMELAYQIAPDAEYYYATGIDPDNEDDLLTTTAAAVTALKNAGCNIIIDDLGTAGQESFYQTGTVLDNAINAAVAAGVDYFSAAGNDGNDYYQQGFTPLNTTIAGIGAVTANDFGNGSPYLDLTISRGGTGTSIVVQWAQPFATIGSGTASAQNSLAIYLLDSQGNIVKSSIRNQVGSDPIQGFKFVNTTDSTDFRLVVVQNGNVVPAGELFTVFFANTGGATIENPNAGTGTGDIFGHELLPGTNVVGAVSYLKTPALGVSPAVPEPFSSSGPGTILYDPQGNTLPTPTNANEPTFASADNSYTSVPGFQPFSGTSAAAPNAGAVGALMLQANGALSTTQVTALLEQSAIPVSSSTSNVGAGLIQARAAVELATSAGGTVWSNASGGDWNCAANWSTGLVPTINGPAMISNDLGAFTASYTVTVDTGCDAAGSLTLSAPAGSSVGLAIDSCGTLAIGGPDTDNRTAGDFLVATGGALTLGGGLLTVAGTLNVNDGTVSIVSGQATAANYTQNAGEITVGGGDDAAEFTLTGTSGISQTGGSAAILTNGTISTTTALYSASSLTDAGSITTGAMSLYSTPTSVLQTGSLTASSLTIGASSSTTTASVLGVAGTVIDAGGLTGGSLGAAGTIQIGDTGLLDIGGSTAGAAISFAADGGLLDFSSSDSLVLTSGLDAVISGFDKGSSVIEFSAITYNPEDSYSYSAGSLTILDGSTDLAALALDPAAQYDGFDLMAGTAGALEVAAIPCFAAGTRILTDQHEVAVEALRIGDRVITVDGTAEPIIWLGARQVDCRRHPAPSKVLPVRVRANAFGSGLPRRDLFLSPDHALFMEGVLIPVKHLIDGHAVCQVPVWQVTYFHIELRRHLVIIADGLPAESYLDTGDRLSFAQDGVPLALHPAWGTAAQNVSLVFEAFGYAPLRVTGAEVERARAGLKTAGSLGSAA